MLNGHGIMYIFLSITGSAEERKKLIANAHSDRIFKNCFLKKQRKQRNWKRSICRLIFKSADLSVMSIVSSMSCGGGAPLKKKSWKNILDKISVSRRNTINNVFSLSSLLK